VVIIWLWIADVKSCVYLSSNKGNDVTGNGTMANPYKTIEFAFNHANSMDVELCLEEGTYTNSTLIVDMSKINRLEFTGGAGVVRLSLLNLMPESASAQGFTLSFQQVYLSDIQISANNMSVFDHVVFDTTRIGDNENDVNWAVTANRIELISCVGEEGNSTGSIWLNSTQFVEITDLNWILVSSTGTIFFVNSYSFNLYNSIVKNSTTEGSLFNVTSSAMNNSMVVNIRNVTFDFNQIGDPSVFSITATDTSMLTISNSNLQCNSYKGLVLPFFNTNITVINVNASLCPVQCLDSTLALNSEVILPCVSCGAGNGSVNYICQPCPAEYFSMTEGVCNPCPQYSSQPAAGQSYCNCFSHSYVDGNNSDRCNYEVWGIVVSLIYLIVFVAIFWFRRPKKYTKINEE